MPNKQYNEALTVESAILKKLHRTSKLLLWAKLISFSFSAYAFYRFVSTQLTGPYGWVALAFIGLYLLS
ncbi:MAG: MutS-related protein, partial [Bacteroides sp.]